MHEELSSLPAETHLLAAALVNYADDYGYFNANPVLVKAGTNPLRSDKTDVARQLEQLEAIGYIEIRKEGIKHYGRVITFDAHQRVSHPTASKIKSKFEALPKSSGNIREPLRPEGNREQGMEHEVSKTTSSHPGAALGAVTKHPDLSIYEAYPRKEGKGAAMTAISKAVARLVKGEVPHIPMVKLEAQRYLMRRVLEYARSPVGMQPDATKIPHPATWFNQKRYDDDQTNWHHLETSNGTFKSKSESTLDALRANIEGRHDRDPFGDAFGGAAGECEEAGVRSLCAPADGIRTEVRPAGDQGVVIEATR